MEERSPADVVRLMQDEGVEIVDFRFCDLPGLMQHFSTPAHQLTEDGFEEGYGFDGSSIRGFQEIQESDMILVPDPNTAVIDPFREAKTLNLNCFVRDPVTGDSYTRDPRYVAKKAEDYLLSTGLADTAYFGPEAEFYIFNDVRFHQDQHSAMYSVDSVEGIWNSGADEKPNLGFKPRYKEGYFPVPPMDHFQDLRSKMILMLERVGIETEVQHHEVGTAGQAEIDMRFDTLLRMADKLMLYKYVTKCVAWAHDLSVTFMPKPLFQDNGSGMHCHQSLWKGGEPLFFSETGLRRPVRHGPLVHRRPAGPRARRSWRSPRPRPTRTSGWCRATRRRSTWCTRSATGRRRCGSPSTRRAPRPSAIEFRCPDPSCNPYLAFSAMLMAGLDGVQNRTEPPDPVDKDLYDLPPEELAMVPQVPGVAGRGAARASRPTTTTSPRAASSPPTSSRRGSPTSGPRDRRGAAAAPPVGVHALLRHLASRGR